MLRLKQLTNAYSYKSYKQFCLLIEGGELLSNYSVSIGSYPGFKGKGKSRKSLVYTGRARA